MFFFSYFLSFYQVAEAQSCQTAVPIACGETKTLTPSSNLNNIRWFSYTSPIDQIIYYEGSARLVKVLTNCNTGLSINASSFVAEAGVEYKFQVELNTRTTIPQTFTLHCSPLATNDDCTDAQTISVGDELTVNGGESWYTYTHQGLEEAVIIETCPSSNINIDFRRIINSLNIYTNSCDSLIPVSYSSNASCSNGNRESFHVIPGQTYYIRLNTTVPTVTINVTARQDCATSDCLTDEVGIQGALLREIWENYDTGNSGGLSNLPSFPDNPSCRRLTDGANFQSNVGDNYGTRIRGFIRVDETGDYQFNVTGSRQVRLFLSSDSNPKDAVRIARSNNPTGINDHNSNSSQTSQVLHLLEGRYYYIELRHAALQGADHIGFFWKTPSNNNWNTVPNNNLFSYDCINCEVGCFGSTDACIGMSKSFLREIWTGIGGYDISNLKNHNRYPNKPDHLAFDNYSTFSYGNVQNYAQRIRGYIKAPVTGEFQFNVTGDNDVQFFLSPTTNPSDKNLIASINGQTKISQHTKYSSQTSSVISLQQGQYYYIEVFHKK